MLGSRPRHPDRTAWRVAGWWGPVFRKSFLPRSLRPRARLPVALLPRFWAVDAPTAGERDQRLSVCLAAKGSIVLKYEPDPT